MFRTFSVTLLCLLFYLAGCGPTVSVWHRDATNMLHMVQQEGASGAMQAEYESLFETYSKGESLLKEDEIEDADRFFQLAIIKGDILRQKLFAEKRRLAEEERKRREEARQRELARVQALAREEEERRLKEEVDAQAWVAEKTRLEAEAEVRRQNEQRAAKERSLPKQHTVKRGETLPQIAAQPDIYSDPLMWPLLYRANRDQIRDPRNLWPGQVLRIPRFLSKEEIQEARRYAQERRLH